MVITVSLLLEQMMVLSKQSNMSAQEDLETLRQCVADIRIRAIVGSVAQKCGRSLMGVLTNDALES